MQTRIYIKHLISRDWVQILYKNMTNFSFQHLTLCGKANHLYFHPHQLWRLHIFTADIPHASGDLICSSHTSVSKYFHHPCYFYHVLVHFYWLG
jgi:hypothetical protein